MERQIHSFTINDAKECIPRRFDEASKYDYGKVLVVAGSERIYGAAFLCAKAAFYSGAGMVKVITHINNKNSFENNLYESMFYFYDRELDVEEVERSVSWADTIVMGPGLSTDEHGCSLLSIIFNSIVKKKYIIVDADAINILSGNRKLFELMISCHRSSGSDICITPHYKELSRLMVSLGYDDSSDSCVSDCTDKYDITIVKKGHVTLTFGTDIYKNQSGNEGMATAGSGDVLSGILAGIMMRTDIPFSKKVASGVYFHGFAGDLAARNINTISMTARDILYEIPKVWDYFTTS